MRVYIAGPITKGNRMHHARQALDAAEQVLKVGHAPYVPHLDFGWDLVYPHTHEEWLALDLQWVAVCGALIRLPGESAGSDQEVAFAKGKGIPVFDSVETFLHYASGWTAFIASKVDP